MNVSIFGLGYVGCVTSACLARDGHRVWGVDIDADKVEAVNSGQSPVAEPGLAELLRSQVDAGRLRATTDVRAAVEASELALIAVGTPSQRDGSVQTAAVERVVAAVGQAVRHRADPFTVVIRSTLLPGILEDRLAPILEAAAEKPLGPPLALCNNPEFLREASAIRDYDRPPFVLVGAGQSDEAESVLALYESVQAEKIVTDTRSAAMVKYVCNAFHALKVAFANEVGALARAFGADGQEVMNLVCRDTQLNISPAYLRPGFAFGGSCLPKDVRALGRFAEQQAIRSDLLGSILASNQSHFLRGVEEIEVRGHRRLGLVGLSFKAGTDDLRESPLVALAETLLGRGFQLKIYDPGIRLAKLVGTNRSFVDQHLPHLAALLVEDSDDVFRDAELVVLGTDIADQVEVPPGYGGEILDLRRDLVAAHHQVAGT